MRTAKTHLALLYELARQERLSAQDGELVLRYVPETLLLSGARADRRVRHGKDDWVIKPGISFQGRDVLFGKGMSASQWSTPLETIPAGVVQRVVPSDPIPVLVHGDGGFRVETHGRLVLMPHFLAGCYAGTSARYSATRDVLGRIDFRSVFSTVCVEAKKEA